jgi:YrbI family 3-deoxy-D-manno-octulosonate 8-phosphate phosphatase
MKGNMKDRVEVLAVVPARGGSKGIPGKNIRLLAGHPLVAYSIAAGLKAQTVTRLILSTDDERIAEVGRRYGAEVPFLRPAELARDDTLDLPVFAHALAWLRKKENYRPKVVVHLRPTSPLRPKNCVDDAVRLLLSRPEADSVRTVIPSEQNPYKMWRLAADGSLKPLLAVKGLPEPFNAPRQALPATYWQTGHVDAVRPSVILNRGSMSGKRILPLVVDSRFAVDLDKPSQWPLAESLLGQAGPAAVSPGRDRRPLPAEIGLVVLDFDGVMTDNRVWVDGEGHEYVAASRGDGAGVVRLRKAGVELLVLSTEVNPVVAARCRKLGISYLQGIQDKAEALKSLLEKRGLDPSRVVFVGNDYNDLPCFELVSCAVAPADAEPEVLRQADLLLSRRGGHGAVRELCDLLLGRIKKTAE